MSRWMWLVVLVAASVIQFPMSVNAKRPSKGNSSVEWAPVTETDWKAGVDSILGSKGAVMIFEKISVDERKFDKDDCSLTLYRRIRILNESGRAWADVEAPPEYEGETPVLVFGRTVLPGGEEFELNAEHIHRDTVVKAGEEEVYQTRFSMPGVTKDCIIEYRLKYASINSREWVVQKDIPLLHGEYQWYYFDFVKARKAWDHPTWYTQIPFVRFYLKEPEHVWQNLPTRAPKAFPLTKDSTELIFEVDSISPFESEPVSLPDRALKGRLNCQNGAGTLDIECWSTMTASMADWTMKDFVSRSVKMKSVGSSLEGATPKEKMQAAYNWLQANISNTFYEDPSKSSKGKGSAARRNHKQKFNETADDVIEAGKSWHLEISALYCAMLRELGLDARLALVVDRDKDIFERRVQDWQFDHSLVAVYDSAGKVRFFSPGVPYLPYGMVPWFNEGVTALVEGPQGTMITVPPAGPDLTEETEVYTLAVSPDAKTTGTVQARLTGHAAASVRGNILYVDSSEYAESLKDAVADFLPDGTIDSLVCGAAVDINSPLAVTCRVEFPPVETAGDKILFKPMDYFVTRQNPFISTKRQTPIAFGYAYRRREAAQINIPEGWVVEALPSDSLFSNRVGDCGVQFTQIGNMLSVQRIFKLNAPLWQVADYKDVRVLFQAREDMSERIVVLKKDAGATTKP
jgi:hypothetical protein